MKDGQKRRDVFVFAHWVGMTEPVLMGTLHSEVLRGREVFSFEYDESWLKGEHVHQLDPDLQLYSGLHYLNERKPNFGLFLDSSPDQWGRILMRKREIALARKERRKERNLFETDYLLGVYDGHRMGALRFKSDMEGSFLDDNRAMATPPWTSIRELEEISLKLEGDDAVNDPDYFKWLMKLVAPGSSLGGSRPKASVVDPDNQLWIAKFPGRNDQTDMGVWEMVTHDLAIASGIRMAECQVRKYSGNHHTFLTKRFDRTPTGERIHFASALTMLGYVDGQDHNDGASYLELVEFITARGANVAADLEELWRRIVFSICVSNTDDHLRNHGFLLTRKGWILSPAYDINPDESGTGLRLNISESDNSPDLALALAVSKYFRLSQERARTIIDKVTSVVRDWRRVARRYGIPNAEQELKSRAFSLSKSTN